MVPSLSTNVPITSKTRLAGLSGGLYTGGLDDGCEFTDALSLASSSKVLLVVSLSPMVKSELDASKTDWYGFRVELKKTMPPFMAIQTINNFLYSSAYYYSILMMHGGLDLVRFNDVIIEILTFGQCWQQSLYLLTSNLCKHLHQLKCRIVQQTSHHSQ